MSKSENRRTKSMMKYFRRALIFLLAAGVALAVYITHTIGRANFHIVASGQVYRSGQMNAQQFAHTIQEYHIKSILNLRGENPTSDWYKSETQTASALNIAHYDRSLNAGRELTSNEMEDLVALLRKAPKPILIHCKVGADRTGLASALYCLSIEGQHPEEAAQQLSIWYGHVPFIRPSVSAMDRSFLHYAEGSADQLNQ